MNKVVSIQLEWKYAPSNYFEEQITISEQGAELVISNGLVIADIDPVIFESKPDITTDLTKAVESRLYAVQIMTHKNFTLSKPSRSDLREDGTMNIFLQLELAVMKMTCGTADFIVRDKDGNIVSDTRKERLDKQTWFAEKVNKYRTVDSALNQMIKSYQMAVKDPDNELVHLYEIRDVVTSRFGKKKNAMKQLGITENDWNVLGDLANNQPIQQGRHRGKAAGFLRKAEVSELDSARKIASQFIEKYLHYMEGSKPLTNGAS